MQLLALLPLLGFTLFLQRKWSFTASQALVLAVSSWLLLAFTGGLLALLKPVSMAIWIAGAIVLINEVRLLLRDQPEGGIEPVIGLFVLFCAGFWLVHHDSRYFYFDEFGHWGIFIKDMWALDTFWQADSNALHRRYPPGAQVWQYAFTIFAPKVDASAYFAQFVLLIAPLMVLFERLTWKQPVWILGLVIAAVIGLSNFGHGIASLYVDHLVSTWFAGTLLIFMHGGRSAPIRLLLLLALPITVLTLLKDAGFAFALAAAAIIGAIVFADRVVPRRALPSLGLAALLTFALVAPSIVSLTVWSMNRDAGGVETETQSLSGVVRGVIHGDTVLSAEQSALVGERFRQVFLHQQLSKDEAFSRYNEFNVPMMNLFEDRFRLTTANFYLYFALFFIVLLYVAHGRKTKTAWGLLALGVLGTAIAYSLVLYLSYLFAFGDRGPLLSSYIRYTHSAVLALYLVAIAALAPVGCLVDRHWRIRNVDVSASGAVLAAILLAFLVFETPYPRSFLQPNPALPMRDSTDQVADQVREAVGDRRLWVFFPGDSPNGFIGHLIQFQLAPTPTTIERSAEVLDSGPEHMATMLANYEVLWFPMPNPELDEKASGALGVELEDRFVEVVTSETGEVSFRSLNLLSSPGP